VRREFSQVADPKHISHVTPAQIHHMKKLADDYIDIETRIIAEYQVPLLLYPLSTVRKYIEQLMRM
jgi:hypothetical protein